MKPKSTVPFFEEMLRAKSERRYWRTLLYKKRSSSRTGLKKRWEGHKEEHAGWSKVEKLVALRNVEEKITDCYRKRFEKREMFLNKLVSEAEVGGEIEKERALKTVAEKEKRQREYRRLRYILKPKAPGAIPEVEVPSGGMSVDEMWLTLKEERQEPERWETVNE